MIARILISATLGITLWAGTARAQDIPTRVYLNGVPTPVHFNDGDSFRVLAGPHANTKARLAGFNTLESYGPVHRWGTWHAKELYAIAKLATLNAQRGVWHCTTEFDTDTYGRILWYCPDLARDQIRRGLAHALTIDATPSDAAYLAAQRQAIEARRGIWAHGVPAYIMTSLHSTTEGGSGDDGKQYNRLVSTRDGHSNSWAHEEAYEACQWVCATERAVSPETVTAAAAELRKDPRLQDVVTDLDEPSLEQIVDDYARVEWFAGLKDRDADEATQAALKEKRAKLETALGALQDAGKLGTAPPEIGSCVLYVDFDTRYGNGRPECLR